MPKVDYEYLLTHINEGVYFTDTDRRITFWNRAAESITGYMADEVQGHACAENILVHVDDMGTSLCQGLCPLAAAMQDGQAREAEVFLRHKDGHRVPVLVRTAPLIDDTGTTVGGVEMFVDNTPKVSLDMKVKELEQLAMQDKLTGLSNRHHIEAELNQRMEEMRRYDMPFGVLMMDVDHFKSVNDTHGHDIGDRVLQTVAKTLESASRPFDLFGRWGGEEFIGIIRNVDRATLADIGNRCRNLIAASRVTVADLPDPISVTISVGATLVQHDDTQDVIIKRADLLLYESKTSGRNRLTIDLPSLASED